MVKTYKEPRRSFALRIGIGMLEEIEQIADNEGRNMADVIRRLLREALDARKAGQP